MAQVHVLVDGDVITIERNPPSHPKHVRKAEQYCMSHYGSQAYVSRINEPGVWYGYNLPAANGHGFYAEWAEISFNQLPKEVRLYLLIGA